MGWAVLVGRSIEAAHTGVSRAQLPQSQATPCALASLTSLLRASEGAPAHAFLSAKNLDELEGGSGAGLGQEGVRRKEGGWEV